MLMQNTFNRHAEPDLRGVYWYGEKAGDLIISGESGTRESMAWISAGTTASKILEGDQPGKMPQLLKTLSPEGWLAEKLLGEQPKNIKYLKDGLRYLSNITILNGKDHLMLGVQKDAHEIDIDDHRDANGQFSGRYSGPAAEIFDKAMDQQVAALWQSPVMPKFSGAQVKIPTSLLPDGVC